MRKITHAGETIDYTNVANLSQNYDAKNFDQDTEYVIFNSAVLGNSSGIETVEGDDKSSALATIHGRKYNNARIAIPFTRKFVEEHYAEIDGLIQTAATKMSGQCAQMQEGLTDQQKADGRDLSMRSQAIRDARKDLLTQGIAVDGELFSRANRDVRGRARSKVYFQYGMSVSARRVDNKDGLENKGQFKRKNVKSVEGASYTAYVATADESGLKKVPIFNTEQRNKAEELVYKFALVVQEAVGKVGADWSEDQAFTMLKEIVEKMPGNEKLEYQIPEYTDEEISQMNQWKNEIIDNYMNPIR